MIDLSLMSKQEKIIIITLLGGIIIILLMMFTPAKVRKEGRLAAAPQNILTTGGAPGKDRGYFSTPKDIAIDRAGDIYIVDTKNNRIQKFNSAGNFMLTWGREGDRPGEFKEPCGIDTGQDGNIYVADTWNGRIQVFTNTGGFIRELGRDRGMWGPRDVAVDRNGNIYAADTGNGKIEKFDEKGRYITTFGKKGGGTNPGEFKEPFGLTVGPDNNLYVLDRKNFRVQVLSLKGKFLRAFKVDGWAEGQVVSGCLMEPYLDIDEKNRLIYISDSTNHRILRYDLKGKKKKFILNDKRGVKFSCPVGIAVMKNSQILVTDHFLGKVITIAGN